jgi:hypothetical protein
MKEKYFLRTIIDKITNFIKIIRVLFFLILETGLCLHPQTKAYSVGPNR